MNQNGLEVGTRLKADIYSQKGVLLLKEVGKRVVLNTGEEGIASLISFPLENHNDRFSKQGQDILIYRK
ncbi:hypothetical protein [Alkalihalobacillus sp. TS-13]|uniref:hypothetical protein n=1 Tax=Alkalihalobacillus sp. TS-13 TaxID=2842455 RepID=UPI001C8860D4|nr:hypothetical protein [Alkalihalobacillus sp. TS-13]